MVKAAGGGMSGGSGARALMAAEYDDEDVLSSGNEISDDSEDLMAQAADGQVSDSSDDDDSEDEGEDEGDEGSAGEDDEAEEGEEEEPANQPAAVDGAAAGEQPAKQRKHGQGLSAEEHDMLLMAQTTSETTVMQLQVAELLKETRANLAPADASLMANDLQRLRRVLTAITPHQVQGKQAAGFLRDLGLSPAAVSLQFQPPTVVAASGSLPLGACMAQSPGPDAATPPTLDIALAMPATCFYRKAHLNYRYHALRALYLATVTNHLAACPAFASRAMHLEALQSDPTRPVLVIAGEASKPSGPPAYRLRLIPCASPSLFALARLAPDRNAVRWVRRKQPAAAPATAAVAAPAVGAPAPASVAGTGAATAAVAAAAPAAAKPAPVTGAGGGVSTAHLAPTPTYNMGIMADMLVLSHAALLQRTAAALPMFADGLLLLKVWAHQHHLAASSGSADGLDGHTMAMLLTHLAERGKLTPAMSALQIFRAALHALSGADPSTNLTKGFTLTRLTSDQLESTARAAASYLLTPGTSHGSAKQQQKQAATEEAQVVAAALGTSTTARASPLAAGAPPSLSAFRKAHAAVLVDPAGWCNLACQLSKAALTAVTAAARASVAVLSAPVDGEAALASVLLSPSRLASCYDYMWAVDVPQHATYEQTAGVSLAVQAAAAAGDDERQGQEHWHHTRAGDVCVWREQESAIEALVRTALTDRAHLVRAVRRPVVPAPPSALASGLLYVTRPHEVLVGARLDPTLALRLVDIGPPADDLRAAARFRAFWGAASELRRFQDGKISEAVVWGAPGAALGARHAAPDRAVAYALDRHRPAGALGTLRSSGSILDGALRGEDDDPRSADAAVTAGRLLEAATDKLSKQLRAMEGLALKIVAVQPLSAAARHTEVVTPLPHPLAGSVPPAAVGQALAAMDRLPRVVEPQDMLVQLENSGRWPAQPVAFCKMKAALGLQLAQAIESSLGLTAQATEEYIDVLSDGFAFRLTLYSGRDETMLVEQARSQPQAPGTGPITASPETQPLIRSWHHGLVSRVGGANPAYGPACRLAKRWVSAHLMSNHVMQEAVELMMAAVFTTKGPNGAPGSRVAGFLRFLELLSHHPWSGRPLVVDPDASLTPADLQLVHKRFAERRGLPGGGGAMPALYLVTPKDLVSHHWTRERPSPPALAHLTSLATSCLAAAAQLLEEGLPHSSSASAPTANGTRASAVDRSEDSLLDQAALDQALLGALYSPQMQQFDVMLHLRREALPRAAQALPAWLTTGCAKRHRQPDALTCVMEEAREQAPPKRARAFLDAFPEQALATRSPAALREELLVGFDPVELLLSKVQSSVTGGATTDPANPPTASSKPGQPVNGAAPGSVGQRSLHLPLLATLCTDDVGGQFVGVKWAPAAFLPAPAKVNTCHASLPCLATKLAASTTAADGVAGSTGPACVPDVSRILTEMCEVGDGIVAGVQVLRGCSKLPVGAAQTK